MTGPPSSYTLQHQQQDEQDYNYISNSGMSDISSTSSNHSSFSASCNNSTTTNSNTVNANTLWSELETPGMKDAKCSLLLQEEVTHDAKIKVLPKQRVLVYQDKGFNPASPIIGNTSMENSNNNNGNNIMTTTTSNNNNDSNNYYVDFKGATILQLEPTLNENEQQSVMPITLTIGGRCVFTPENYQDFRVMMRTKEQSIEMSIPPNGSFDWPDVHSLLLCPVCGSTGPIPRAGDKQEHEYWLVFYPLLQITVLKGTQMTLGTRTICRLVCLDCMDDLLEGLTLEVNPGRTKKNSNTNTNNNNNNNSMNMSDGSSSNNNNDSSNKKSALIVFTLPAADVLAEAGSASFLEDGPPRPESHPHVDDILDAWTLYNLWEHSGAWEALQNDYRITLSRSMHADATGTGPTSSNTTEVALKHRIGTKCGNTNCNKIHGYRDNITNDICRLYIKCRECHTIYYCSKECRELHKDEHFITCLEKKNERQEKRIKRAKKVECDTCTRKFPYTKMKKCSSCRNATYCSVDCQRMDWQRHKYNCKR